MQKNRIRTRANANAKRKDITLMTLIANEATSDARKLLKKYGKQDAKDHEDLEVKLAELYFGESDKIQLEKELADIHPHKKWLLKYIQPIEAKKEEPKIQIPTMVDSKPVSNFEGLPKPTDISNNIKTYTPMDYIGVFGVLGIIGLTFYAISNSKK